MQGKRGHPFRWGTDQNLRLTTFVERKGPQFHLTPLLSAQPTLLSGSGFREGLSWLFSTVELAWWIWWCEILLYGNDVRPNHKHFTDKRKKKFCGVHEWKASTSSRLELLETTCWKSWPSCCHSLLSSLSALPVMSWLCRGQSYFQQQLRYKNKSLMEV